MPNRCIKLLVTLVLLSALMAVVGSQAQAVPAVSSGSPGTTLSSNWTSTPDSGEPDAGQTGKNKWRPAAGTQPGFGGSFPRSTGIMWFRWAGAMWAARYLGVRL